MNGLQLIATGGALPGRDDHQRRAEPAWWIPATHGSPAAPASAPGTGVPRTNLPPRWPLRPRGRRWTAAASAPADIACCVCATLSAPDATPSVACQVQAALGLPENRPALDINAACSGFLYGMAVARGMLATLGGQYALVIGCEALSRLIGPRRPLHLRAASATGPEPPFSGWQTPPLR